MKSIGTFLLRCGLAGSLVLVFRTLEDLVLHHLSYPVTTDPSWLCGLVVGVFVLALMECV